MTLLIFSSCENSYKSKQNKELKGAQEINSNMASSCDYIKDYRCVGNGIIDTMRVDNRLVDPIDDFKNFHRADFGFVKRDGKIYKQARTHRRCGEEYVDVEYYQEFTNRIELDSYKEYDDRYFATRGRVNFWWVNSNGHLIVPISNANPETFKPFQDICGGIDKKGIFYGCPNLGVNQLNIPVGVTFEFIPKKDNYWNSPSHYAIVNNKVYDVKYELEKGYFCELDKTISVREVLKMKK